MGRAPNDDASQYDGPGPSRQSPLSRRAVFPLMVGFGLAAAWFPTIAPAIPEGAPSFLTDIVAVPDGRSVRFADGRVAILPHLLPPGPDRHAPMTDTSPIRAAARALADMTLGRRVRVDLATPGLDRHGRPRARLLVDGLDVSIAMVEGGFARVFPEPGADPNRVHALIAAENAARRRGAGFWRTGIFAVADADPYSGGADRFEIVEGKPRAVTRVGRRDHLEFGTDWRVDFTVGLSRATSRALPMETLVGRVVSARGWIRTWNGPFMEIDEPTRLIVDPT
jgi:micrococcal nuclease